MIWWLYHNCSQFKLKVWTHEIVAIIRLRLHLLRKEPTLTAPPLCWCKRWEDLKGFIKRGHAPNYFKLITDMMEVKLSLSFRTRWKLRLTLQKLRSIAKTTNATKLLVRLQNCDQPIFACGWQEKRNRLKDKRFWNVNCISELAQVSKMVCCRNWAYGSFGAS